MATRVFLHGRQVYGPRVSDSGITKSDWETLNQPPYGFTQLPDPGYVDGPFNLRFPKIDNVHPESHWLPLVDICKLLGKKPEEVADYARSGQVGIAVVRGTSVWLFRVRDAAILKQQKPVQEVAKEAPVRYRRTKEKF